MSLRDIFRTGSLRRSLEEALFEAENLRAEADSLRTENTRLSLTLRDLERQLAAKRSEAVSLRRKVEEWKRVDSEINDLHTMLEKAAAIHDEDAERTSLLRKRLRESTAENARLRSLLAAAKATVTPPVIPMDGTDIPEPYPEPSGKGHRASDDRADDWFTTLPDD